MSAVARCGGGGSGNRCSMIRGRKSTILYEVCRQLSEVQQPMKPQHVKPQPMKHLQSSSAAEGPCTTKSKQQQQHPLADDPRSKLLSLNGMCEYCGVRRASTTDHFRPLIVNCQPTKYCNDVWNRIPACKECNCSKGNLICEQWLQSDCPGNPCAKDRRRMAAAVEKFRRYDAAFRRHCTTKTVDGGWWSGIVDRVSEFLTKLQHDVNAYRGSGRMGTAVGDADGPDVPCAIPQQGPMRRTFRIAVSAGGAARGRAGSSTMKKKQQPKSLTSTSTSTSTSEEDEEVKSLATPTRGSSASPAASSTSSSSSSIRGDANSPSTSSNSSPSSEISSDSSPRQQPEPPRRPVTRSMAAAANLLEKKLHAESGLKTSVAHHRRPEQPIQPSSTQRQEEERDELAAGGDGRSTCVIT
jgi:5-methylcytosine-specific restriction endonuclease McrA